MYLYPQVRYTENKKQIDIMIYVKLVYYIETIVCIRKIAQANLYSHVFYVNIRVTELSLSYLNETPA